MLRSIAIILISLCLFSCSSTIQGFHGLHGIKSEKSRVILKNGDIIEAQKVKLKHSLFSNKIIADDTSYFHGRNVAFYSNYSNYANVAHSRFATMVIFGKISVYRTADGRASMGNGQYATGRAARSFLQSGDSSRIYPYRYRYINAMIPASAPEKLMLAKFKQTRRLSSLGIYLGAILLPASIAFTAVQGDRHPESNLVGPVGAAMITTFTTTTIIAVVKKVNNHRKLMKIIKKYDGY
jgi:hypothetical protein